ncbi:MAG: hypothetical protein ACFFA1_07335 [Promethearchaeota archaeon]
MSRTLKLDERLGDSALKKCGALGIGTPTTGEKEAGWWSEQII